MLDDILLVVHISVLGYWLGAELVINSLFRYVCWADDMPFMARDRLMGHVLTVDQHVRYALALQLVLGIMLAASHGHVPGAEHAILTAGLCGMAWLGFIELAHRLRTRPGIGQLLAQIDRASRYALMIALTLIAFGANYLWGWSIPFWLRVKIFLFVGVMACGIAIRFALIAFFHEWRGLSGETNKGATELVIRQIYWGATRYLFALWAIIAVIAGLSIFKLIWL